MSPYLAEIIVKPMYTAEDEELPESGRVPALFHVFQDPSVPEPDGQRSVQEAGPLGDEGAPGDAGEAERREAGVPEGEADGEEDVRGIDQQVADHRPDGVLHADEPALEGEQREGGRGRPDADVKVLGGKGEGGRGRPDADVKVLGGKGLHLGRAFYQEERHLHHDPLQGDQREARSEGDPERPFQGDRDVRLGFRHPGAVTAVGLRRQSAGSSPQEPEVPVQHVEEHRADGDAADEGGGAEAARGAQVPEHAQVGCVAFGGDFTGVHGRLHGAAGLVGVRAGGEPAPLGGAEHLGEILADLLLLEVHEAEAAKPRRINDIATRRKGIHLVQGGGVLPLQVGRGNLADLGVQGRVQRLDEGGLADARFPGEEVDLPAAGFPEFVDAFSGHHGRVDDAVARPFVDGVERIDLLRRELPVQVHLRQDDGGRDAVHAAGDEDAVQEGRRRGTPCPRWRR